MMAGRWVLDSVFNKETAMLCTSLALGYHIATSHHDYGKRQHHMNEFNPGIYAQCGSLVVGGYLNSIGNASLYAAKEVRVAQGLSLVVGGVTGYAKPSPMLMLSYRTGDGTRYSFIPTTPGARGGLHISREF